MNDEDEDTILLSMLCASTSIIAGVLYLKETHRFSTPRRPIYGKRRHQQSEHHSLMAEMRLYDEEMFFHFTRMNVRQFDNLLSIVGPFLVKRSHRESLNPENRLAITVRFLATGSSQQTLAFQFRVGKSTICNVLHETCDALWNCLNTKVIIKPSEENWLKVSNEFAKLWNFPHCIGALDGKHFRVQCPNNTGAEFSHNKKYINLILLAMCDAKYKFTIVDVGGVVAESDGSLFSRSRIGKALEENNMCFPPPSRIGNSSYQYPYFLVADKAFPLKENIMRPYPDKDLNRAQLIFNYRLSRARRVIENALGILVSRWKILQGGIIGNVDNIEKYILAAICLHNFLRKDEDTNLSSKYCPPNFIDREVNGVVQLGEWRQQVFDSQLFQHLPQIGSNNAKKKDYELRNNLCNYFSSREGAVPWQDESVDKGITLKKN